MNRLKFKYIYLIVFLISSLFTTTVFAQNDSAKNTDQYKIRKNSIYFGSPYGSLNYDRIFPLEKNYLAIRFGFLSFQKVAFMGEINYMIGRRKHFIELGIGGYVDGVAGPAARAGYRYQGRRGLVFRYSPLFYFGDYQGPYNENVNDDLKMSYGMEMNFGYAF